MSYGVELVLDIHKCNPTKFNRKDLDIFFEDLCRLIDMEKCERYWWDDVGLPEEECQTEAHLKGTSVVQYLKMPAATQFIMTSSITIHALDIMKTAYINIFSCKEFDHMSAEKFAVKFFEGEIVQCVSLIRI